MSITLPPELERFVNGELSIGRYQSEEELVCEAVRLLQARRTHDLQVAVQTGLDQVSHGEGIALADDDLDSFFDAIESEVAEELAEEKREA